MTVITHPDGSITTIETRTGCSSGCGSLVIILLVLFVIATPAESFPLWLAVPAYILEGVIAIAWVIGVAARRGARHGGRP